MGIFVILVVVFIIWVIYMSAKDKEMQTYQAEQLEKIKELCRGGHTYYEFMMVLGTPSQVKQAGNKMFLANWIRPCGIPISVASFFDMQSGDLSVNAEIFDITG